MNERKKQKTVIVVKSHFAVNRTTVTAANYSTDGSIIAAGCGDGSLWIWSSKGNFMKPDLALDTAHMSGGSPSCITFSNDGYTLVTRAMDGDLIFYELDTLKLWDMRKFTAPIATQSNLINLFEESNVIYSPDYKYIITG